MKQYQIDRIKDLMTAKSVTLKDLAAQCHISEMTVRRILTAKHNPTTDTVEKIAEALGVHEHYIYEPEGETQSKVPINGYIEYGDTILKIKTFKQLEKAYNDIKHDLDTPKLAKSLIAQDKANQKTQSKQPIDIKTIDLFKREQYDTSKLFTWSFRKSDDEKEDMLNDLGNMCQGYPFNVCGERFLNSECAYISGMFSQNTAKAIEIQKELQKCDNGYGAKKEIRRKYEKVGFARDDWNSYNVHWMLFVCWCKVTQNKEFAEKLRKIPSYAMIVENSTFQKAQNGNDTAAFWGMRNESIKEAIPILETAVEVESYTPKKKDMDKVKMEARNSVNHIGTWEGVNCMGKILTICKHCLEDGTQPPIDYELLRSKQIYLFGKLLTFDDVPKAQETAIPEPTSAKKAKAKETPTRKKKVAQEVKNEIVPSEIRVKGIIGAVIGEVVGSRFEFAKSLPKKRYELFASQCSFTDDTVLTVAVADSLLHGKDFKNTLWEWALHYPHAGFGKSFKQWKKNKKNNEEATNDSKGNGCGMRVSPIGFHAKTLEEALELARQSAIISHNSDEGIKGAQSIAAATFLAKQQTPKEEIKKYIEETFGYNLHMTDEEIKAHVNSLTDIGERQLAENTCPLAIIAFLVTDDYEDAIRKAIGYFIDTDTVACMTGGIAAAYYGAPLEIVNEVADFLPQEIINIINEFDHIHLKNSRITPKDCHRWGDIIVYGSGDNKNGETEGFTASKYFGAGKVLEGMDKRAYAIPTVRRSLDEIRASVDRFIKYAETNQDKTFLVTRIGCSKAGYTPKDIAPMFVRASNMTNVYLPIEFREVLSAQ